MAVGNLLESTGGIDMTAEVIDPTTTVFAFAYMLAFVVFIISVVVVSMWIHRAHANLFAGGVADHEYTPGLAVGWFFIPFANLVKPFQAMRELWFASRRDRWDSTNTTRGILGWWWACWLTGNGLSNVGARMTERGAVEGGGFVSLVSAILLNSSAILLLKIIRSTTEAQTSGQFTAGVFD